MRCPLNGLALITETCRVCGRVWFVCFWIKVFFFPSSRPLIFVQLANNKWDWICICFWSNKNTAQSLARSHLVSYVCLVMTMMMGRWTESDEEASAASGGGGGSSMSCGYLRMCGACMLSSFCDSLILFISIMNILPTTVFHSSLLHFLFLPSPHHSSDRVRDNVYIYILRLG